MSEKLEDTLRIEVNDGWSSNLRQSACYVNQRIKTNGSMIVFEIEYGTHLSPYLRRLFLAALTKVKKQGKLAIAVCDDARVRENYQKLRFNELCQICTPAGYDFISKN